MAVQNVGPARVGNYETVHQGVTAGARLLVACGADETWGGHGGEAGRPLRVVLAEDVLAEDVDCAACLRLTGRRGEVATDAR